MKLNLLQSPMYLFSTVTFQEALPYLTNYRNPCWYENITTAEPYKNNFFWNTGRDVYKKYFNRWAVQVKELYSHAAADNPGQRLRCLPLVYQIGIAKCGTTDLYFNLLQHPLIQSGGYKEPHYWSLFRFRGQYRMDWNAF